MTVAGDASAAADAPAPDALEAAARVLAGAQRDLLPRQRRVEYLLDPPSVARPLERARQSLDAISRDDATLSKAAEWFLDNYYLIRRVARQVEEELPRGFVRHLPQPASGDDRGRPRLDALARVLVAKSGMGLDLGTLGRFVDAYQAVSPLTIAEIWALPTVLRATVLTYLIAFLDDLHVDVRVHDSLAAHRPFSRDGEVDTAALSLAPVAGVEQSIRALRVLDVIDWKVFFERTSRVQAILRTDPAQVYARMDFDTCDSYRKVVESLARTTATTEEAVADLAIALARDGAANEPAGHVGYYLLAAGRRVLEERLGYRSVGLERLRRALTRRPTVSYLLPVALLTLGPALALAWGFATTAGRGEPRRTSIAFVVAFALGVVPVSSMAVSLVQWAFARLLPPRVLPKLDFARAIPRDARTLVVMPTLLGRAEEVAAMLRQLELHYLSNPDSELVFALLTDLVDTEAPPAESVGAALVDDAARGIDALNAKHGADGHGPFHLLHRRPIWNPAERRVMGWERKRGKLEELNRLLRGDTTTSYCRHVGYPEGLLGIRFVITLDLDTELPMGSARRLIGLLAHPLNRAVFDAETGRVVTGYTIAQPRIEVSPSSARVTPFARIFAGDVGFDIYTRACSELYQDLFGSGIYVGKGIYDVDAFLRSVDRRAPENTLVSHDLFEGIHGRTALATDIPLFESYPSNYATYAVRLHRWVRGDWQLLPWLFPRVPSAQGKRIKNLLGFIERWKIVDNLRRSLNAPLLSALLVLGWICLPAGAWIWTLGTLALLLTPFASSALRGSARLDGLGRAALAIVFLAHEASVVVDAVARTVVRMTVTRRHLLQWTSAARAASEMEGLSLRRVFWRTMIASPLFAVAAGGVLAHFRPSSLSAAAPLLLTWLLAPEVARWVSGRHPSRAETIAASDRKRLRLLARRTWRFFDAFVGPEDQWLPIDNHQEEPRKQTAHRTSPTNIGLMLVATLSAYDFGYVGPGELSLRLRMAFDSLSRMTHYQGHLFNWYDTTNLQPLLPRYVSTVDSGNLAGCLLALQHGCTDVATLPVVRAATWDGLCDSVDLLEEVVTAVPGGAVESLRSVLARMRDAAGHARDHLDDAYETLRTLCDETSVELDRELLAFLESGAHRYEADVLHALRTSIERLHQHLHQMRRELDTLLPWLALGRDASAHGVALPAELHLDEIPAAAMRLRLELEAQETARRQRGEPAAELDASAARLGEAFSKAEANARALVAELLAIAERASREARGMDFKLLYDSERRLFRIGYNATLDQLDAHYYDLLASEARLASYLAIVKRDVPVSHWYALGRPLTRVHGAPALLSWGGTMFEYLMPGLLMRSHEGTLLASTARLAVDAQIAYAKNIGEPWGVSESAYARLDAEQTYQYRSFGVPGLGFKRGLEEDRVVTPYASILAASIRPRAVVENVVALEARGMLGTYGLFEALDATPERALELGAHGQPFAVVRSYMAHHQGMLLVALGNLLNARTMVDRFHSDPMVETGVTLLNEHAPGGAPAEWPTRQGPKPAGPVEATAAPPAPGPWSSTPDGRPDAFVLGNGRLTSLVTGSGGGGLRWLDLALTRFEPDATHDADGIWLYLRDDDKKTVWRATSAEGRTTFAMHKVELHLRRHGISARVEVAVAPADDVEVRLVTLHNETDRVRRLTITTAARPVLLDAKQAPTHPAFSSMFVESERVAELDAVLFARRPQTASEPPVLLLHRLVREGAAVTFAGYETDRATFFGRTGSATPASLTGDKPDLTGSVGAVIDPVMSLSARIILQPKSSVTLAYVTTAARSRSAVLELARKYGTMHAVRWALRDAEQESPRRLQRTKLDPALLPAVQRLFSALLFADPTVRASPKARAEAPPCQRRLWGLGISGDDPILLVRVHNPDSQLLRDVFASQRYLRSCGVRLDLVLVDEQASGYVTDRAGTLRRALVDDDVEEWLDRHGGIYVIAADRTGEADLRHLESSARVALDTREPSLAARMGRVVESPPGLPQFEPTLADDAAERPRPRPTLLFDNGIGGFSEDGREYVIELRPGESTPAPWCNVLANHEFGCLVSESSLGASWSLNSGENRLTPWRNDPVFDTPSEALYLRDEETAAIWSPTPLPAGKDGTTLVRHGAGYTTYERESHGLVQKLTVFVPPDASLKVVRLRVTNTLARHRRLTATYYAEWVLGSRRESQRPFIVSEFAAEQACLLATCDWNGEFAGRVAFLASNAAAHGFTADRAEFLGRAGDYARPEALRRWGLSGRVDVGADPCAALQVHIDLGPGEAMERHFVLGQSASRDEALELVSRFRDRAVVEAAWERLHAFWDGLLGNVRVKTPEPSMDLMLNRWLLYQTIASRIYGRTAFYQSSGAFGYRDQLQDVLALLHGAPAIARAHILEAARHQFEEGDVLHWWHPPSGRGVRTRCSDDLAWLPYATAEYVGATGDLAILDEPAPFLAAPPLKPGEHDRYALYEASKTSAPLVEHCRRALERALTHGVHGLPLMGDGDWNDGMSRVGVEGRGESVWLGWFLSTAMDRFGVLSMRRSDHSEASTWHSRAASLRATIEAAAWDGAWYLRAYHDDGSLVGSAQCRECRIDSIAQSWAVLASDTDDEHAARHAAAVHAADDRLVREADRLVLLFWPPFDSTVHDPGYVRAYPPGIRENGGQYTHAASWMGFAHAELGDGARAERIFRLLNPILHARTTADAERYRVEPYALAGDVYSCPPWVGRGGWTWYTGSAAWSWRLGVEAILGLHMEDGHLRVDPCIPPSWEGFEAWVRLESESLHVVVENPDRVAAGVASVTVDGLEIGSSRIPPDPAGARTREVRVRLGPAARDPERESPKNASRARETTSHPAVEPKL